MGNLYAMNLSAVLPEERWHVLLEGLPEERQRRALACRRAEDGARIAGAGWLLRQALDWWGIPPAQQAFIKNPWGKPKLLNQTRPQFSLSHSGPWVLCAVGDAPLGVDIESSRCTMQMASRFFHPREAAFAASLPPEEQAEALCRLWVAKEAFLKAEGTGLHRPLSSFCVRLTKEVASLEIPGTLLRLHEYALGAYRVCLCARESRPALIPVVLPAL